MVNNLLPVAWEDSFPPVYGHTSISYLKNCPGFIEAKSGDMDAALKVVSRCVNTRRAWEVTRNYPDAILLPVVTENKLPEALAEMINLQTHNGVFEMKTVSRKSLSAMERLLVKPVFTGTIQSGSTYIIVDDIITQGGTVSELRKYVIANGGNVAAIVALSCSVGSHILVPGREDIAGIAARFTLHSINRMLFRYEIAYDLCELTRSQVRYLLHFKEMGGIIHKIEQTQTVIETYINAGLRSYL